MAINLDEIRETADKKHGHTQVQVGDDIVTLRNVLRLTKQERKELAEVWELISSDDENEDNDLGDAIEKVLRKVASSAEEADLLLNAIGDDLAVLLEVFTEWSEETEVGEA